MRRISFFALIIGMFASGSCTSFTRQLELKTDLDTLSFYLGVDDAGGIMDYLLYDVGIDTIYLADFFKGLKDGAKKYSPKEAAYMEGRYIAQHLYYKKTEDFNNEIFMGDSTQSIDRKLLLAGFIAGAKDKEGSMRYQALAYSEMKKSEVQNNYARTKYAEIIAAGEKILADNKNKADIKTTASGLQYKIITEGTGPIPLSNSRVKMNYRGKLADWKEFDSSYKNNEPSIFFVGSLISGWAEALLMMPVGSKWELYIPHHLAHGPMGNLPTIPPYATLIFEVELVGIE